MPFAIGRVLRPHALGLYQMAWRVVGIPTQELGRAAAFERVLSAVMLLLLPIVAWLAATRDTVAAVALGSTWLLVGPLLPILALGAVAR